MDNKYLYFSSEDDLIFQENLESLKERFFKLCNENFLESNKESAEEEFLNNIENDGYLILDFESSKKSFFFIEKSKINNIFDLTDEEDVISILNEKLKKNKLI